MKFRSTSRRLVTAALTSVAAVALTAGPTAGTASAQPLSSANERSTASATCLVPNPLPFGPDCIVPDPPASPPPSQPPISEVKTPPPPSQVDPPRYTPLHHMREVHHSGTTPPATPPEAQPTQQPPATPPAA